MPRRWTEATERDRWRRCDAKNVAGGDIVEVVRRALVFLILTAACGRIGIEARSGQTPDPDAADVPDGSRLPDSPAVCPVGTVAIADGSSVCVEQAERGTETWTTAKTTCEGLGRRLCKDVEWASACNNASGLVNMFNDEGGSNLNWEWVDDLVATDVAGKRGYDACDATSAHEIFVDPYDYRCCLDL